MTGTGKGVSQQIWRLAMAAIFPGAALLVLLFVRGDPVAPRDLAVALVLALMLGLAMQKVLMLDGAVWDGAGRHTVRATYGLWQGMVFGLFMALLRLDAPLAETVIGTLIGGALFGALRAAFWRNRGEGAADLADWAGWRRLGWAVAVLGAGALGALAGGTVWMVLLAVVAMGAVPGAGPGREAPWLRVLSVLGAGVVAGLTALGPT